MKRYVLCLLILTAACKQKPSPALEMKQDHTMHQSEDTTAAKPAYSVSMVDNVNDPVCNMPVKIGIEDTAHYKGKVYGFCSKECKAEFRKNEKDYTANIKLKAK